MLEQATDLCQCKSYRQHWSAVHLPHVLWQLLRRYQSQQASLLPIIFTFDPTTYSPLAHLTLQCGENASAPC